MYTTRPLSQYKTFPDSLLESPDGPNSGFLVIQDEESETYRCFGLCKKKFLDNLPFPQNKNLTVYYAESYGEAAHVSLDDVFLVPVLNLPLSANRYYAIKPHGKHKGEAYTCSREEDKTTCCFCRCVKDVKPRPLDPKDMYQQVEITNYESRCSCEGQFKAKSVATDGFPPFFLRRKGWSIYTKTPKDYQLHEALGINADLRARFPEFEFPLSYKSSEAVVVGKWFSPFMFIKDGTLKDQIKTSIFYQITLEQRWDQIYTCQNYYNQENSVNVDVTLDTENAYIAGQKAVWDEKNIANGMILFRAFGKNGEETYVGLREEVVQRMKWEQERGGWSRGGKERQVKVSIEEKFGEKFSWREFGCYVLVESFVVKRMDGSVAMIYDFVHTQHLRSKWE
ncbi:hypothetical protein M9H77_09696 [Catharanthus roseus]|uniref:Uncharacterized protein n=1 Tax=Catharanthus roseus TaxID=4058 RepID=A0ACC0C1T2_CATRO|nr:hypothetical protein M9H77_09696 [Catharanthus roseus]